MAYALQDSPPTLDVPKAKKILIDGRERGDVTPSLECGVIRWHAVIRLGDSLGPAAGLAQGFGLTPDEAITNAICSARRERDRFAAALAAVEVSLGTAGKPSEQLAKPTK